MSRIQNRTAFDRTITCDGVTKTIRQWSRENKIHPRTMQLRLEANGDNFLTNRQIVGLDDMTYRRCVKHSENPTSKKVEKKVIHDFNHLMGGWRWQHANK